MTKSKNLLTVQHYGDATDKDAGASRPVRNEQAQQREQEDHHRGVPCDHAAVRPAVGHRQPHYVEVPPEGIFDMFECTELTYHVNAEKELKTTLTLSPPPSGGAGGSERRVWVVDCDQHGIGRHDAVRPGSPIIAGSYPDAWSPVQLAELPFMTLVEEAAKARPSRRRRTRTAAAIDAAPLVRRGFMTFLPYSERSKDVQDGTRAPRLGRAEVRGARHPSSRSRAPTPRMRKRPCSSSAASSFKLKKDHDTEVFLLSSSSDTS